MADSKQLSVILFAKDAFSPTMKLLNAQLRGVRKNIRDVGRAGDKLTQKLGIPVSFFGISALGGLGAVVKGFAEKGEEISNAVKKIGGTAADLQVFRKAAELANVPTEALDKGLTKLNKNIAEGASGKNKEFASMMRALHIPLRDANKQLRTAGDILPDLANAFERNTNAAVRGRIAAVAFGGKMGAELIPMLVGGGRGLDEVREKLGSMGAIMGDQAVGDAAKLEEAFKWLGIAGRGLQNSIGAQLAPVLTPLVEDLTKWVVKNRELIATKVTAWVKELAKRIKEFDWAGLARNVEAFATAIGKIVDFFGGWGRVLTVVAVILNMSILASFITITASAWGLVAAFYRIGGALMALALANPMILGITVAIAALAYLAYKVYENWEPIKAWFANLWADIKAIFVQNIADLITTVVPFAGLLDRISGGKVTTAINEYVGFRPAGQVATAPSLGSVMAGAQQVKGSFDININGAPPGTRVTEPRSNSSSFFFNPNVGFSSAAMGTE